MPVGLPVTDRRVVRGGAWNDTAVNARAAYRNRNPPANRNNDVGLRVVVGLSHILVPLLWRSASGMCRAAVASAPTGDAGTGNAAGIGRRPRFAAQGEGFKDGAGESRPHG
jgi:hypothetical protein